MVPDYPTNSSLALGTSSKDASQPVPVKVESVVDKKAKVKTKQSVKRFFLEQDLKDIKEGVVKDVIRPKVQEMLYNFVENCMATIESSIQMMIFGDVRRNPNARPGDRVSYNQYSSAKRISQSVTPSMNTAFNCDDLSYETKGDAEAVLISMREHLAEYPFVTVAQLYEFSGLVSQNYTNNNYGWTDLEGVTVKRSFDGDYVIDLPRAKPVVSK